MATYEVRCECGRTIPVEARLAGAGASCFCGRTVPIPNLSQLRRAAGETAIPLTVVERIRLAIRAGELPDNRFCPFNGRPVDDTVRIRVECERVTVRQRGPGWWGQFFSHVVFGWLALFFPRDQGRDEFGHDIVVDVPLAISASARESRAAALGRKSLVDALRGTPLYRELLEEYPAADVWIIDDDPA